MNLEWPSVLLGLSGYDMIKALRKLIPFTAYGLFSIHSLSEKHYQSEWVEREPSPYINHEDVGFVFAVPLKLKSILGLTLD